MSNDQHEWNAELPVVENEIECLLCKKKLKTECYGEGNCWSMVWGGLIFRAAGNFGSTLYDPLPSRMMGSEEFLQFVLCDECVKTRGDFVEHREFMTLGTRTLRSETYNEYTKRNRCESAERNLREKKLREHQTKIRREAELKDRTEFND